MRAFAGERRNVLGAQVERWLCQGAIVQHMQVDLLILLASRGRQLRSCAPVNVGMQNVISCPTLVRVQGSIQSQLRNLIEQHSIDVVVLGGFLLCCTVYLPLPVFLSSPLFVWAAPGMLASRGSTGTAAWVRLGYFGQGRQASARQKYFGHSVSAVLLRATPRAGDEFPQSGFQLTSVTDWVKEKVSCPFIVIRPAVRAPAQRVSVLPG